MLKPLLRRFGYSLKRINKAESEEDILYKAMQLGGARLVIDCGANHGQFYQLCRRSGYDGPIWCIEPNPHCLKTLATLNEQDRALKIIPAGSGDKDVKMSLHSAGAMEDLSSFLDQTPLLTERFKRAEVTGSLEVPVRRLDGLMDEAGLAKDTSVFLKVDTQGYDLVTLEGLGNRINQITGIKAEMSVQAVYDGAPSHWELLDFFRSHGFEPFSFSTVTRDFVGRYIEYDAYFIKTPTQK
jgi:FkbM family methyltransferase